MQSYNEQMARLAEAVGQVSPSECFMQPQDLFSCPLPKTDAPSAIFSEVPIQPPPVAGPVYSPPVSSLPAMPKIFNRDPIQGGNIVTPTKKPLICKKSMGLIKYVVIGVIILGIGIFVYRRILKKKKAAAEHKNRTIEDKKVPPPPLADNRGLRSILRPPQNMPVLPPEVYPQQPQQQQQQQQQQMSLQAMRAALAANTTPMMYAPTAEYGVAETFVPPMLRRPQAANPAYTTRPQTVSPVVDPNFTAI